MKHKGKIIGLCLFLVVIAIMVFAKSHIFDGEASSKKTVVLTGLIGGEKEEFFKDADVQRIFKDKYGIVVNFTKMGSLDMVKDENLKANDFVFPASQTAVDIAKSKVKTATTQTVFSSPLVLYSWQAVADKLTTQGIVKEKEGTTYVTDFPKLINLVAEDKKWSDIGLGELYGNIGIFTSDPVQTNSGSVFSALLANTFNNQNVIDENSVNTVLPKVKKVFAKTGFMQASTVDLFAQFVKTGMGSNPIIVGYENSVITFANENPDVWAKMSGKVKVMYPEPTIWSNHTIVALNDKAKALNTALMDVDIQKIAWEKYGLRTGVSEYQNDVTKLAVKGLPEQITSVMPLPTTEVMLKLINNLN